MAIHRPHVIRAVRPMTGWKAPAYREIQAKIGEELKTRLDVPGGMPHQLLTLLMQMNEQEDEDQRA